MLSLLPLLLLLPFSKALSVSAPGDWISPGNNTVTWSTTSQDDPSVFNVFVVAENASILNGAYGVVQNVQSSEGSRTFVLPPVPLSVSYSIAFTNITNSTDIYATSGLFNIAPNATALSSLSQPFSQSTTAGSNSARASSTGTNTLSAAASASTGGSTSSAGPAFEMNAVMGGLLAAAMGLAMLV
ncbi:hypothetical protein BDY24DRAFT_377820 [Mrakia frigida]|uniref:uncharacterized protein n=1 Tax=Mrakia frigida TaxID=29902 RepID=UPI003FCBFCED